MSISAYNERLLELYNRDLANKVLFGSDEDWRPPLFSPNPAGKGGVLFVGINPSTAWLNKVRPILKESGKIVKGPLNEADAERLARAQYEASHSDNSLSFFKNRHEEATRILNLGRRPIAHLDLLPFRMEGKQRDAINKIMGTFSASTQISDYLELFSLGVVAHAPSILWIANLGAFDQFIDAGVLSGTATTYKEVHRSPRVYVGTITTAMHSAQLFVSSQLSGRPYAAYKEHRKAISERIREHLKATVD